MFAQAIMSGVHALANTAVVAASSQPAASGVLTEAMTQAIQSGFDSLSATVTQVILISVPVSVSIIALTGGVRYALKKVRGVIASAA